MPTFLVWLSVATAGLYAGAMLTEARVLVPYWRAAPPAEFFAWYRANHDRLVRYFGPLTVAAFLTAAAAAGGTVWAGRPGRGCSLAAAVLIGVTVAMFPLYFRGVNDRFAAGTMAAEELPSALARWAAWHRLRTALALAAFGLALLAGRAQPA